MRYLLLCALCLIAGCGPALPDLPPPPPPVKLPPVVVVPPTPPLPMTVEDAGDALAKARQQVADLEGALATAKATVKSAEKARDDARKEAEQVRWRALATWATYCGLAVAFFALLAAVAIAVWSIPIGWKVVAFAGISGLVVAGAAQLLISMWIYLPFAVLGIVVLAALYWVLTRSKKVTEAGASMAGAYQKVADELAKVDPALRAELDRAHLDEQAKAGIMALGDRLLAMARKV